MNPRALALVASCLLSVPAQADGLGASFSALVAQAKLSVAAARLQARPRLAFHPDTSLPENCANLPVVVIRNGEISKNGALLGRSASSYQANCDGLVAWKNSYGELYRETQRLDSNVSQFDVAWHGDVVVWRDSYGELHRNGETFGRVDRYTFVKYTGDVVWVNSHGELHRNRESLGRAQSYAVASRTGDVAWINSFGVLYRNATELGRAQSFQLADRTGDVAWVDSFRNLYKNGVKVGDGVNQFTMREDGKVIWTDSWGNTHYA